LAFLLWFFRSFQGDKLRKQRGTITDAAGPDLALKNLAFRGQNPIVRLPSDRLELLLWATAIAQIPDMDCTLDNEWACLTSELGPGGYGATALAQS
jgi:hypothetical protein